MGTSDISVLILAAGHSTRMGRSKATLDFGNGLTFTEQLVNAYIDAGIDTVWMVVNEEFDQSFSNAERVQFIINRDIDKGRSWSLHLGFQQVGRGHACFIQNIDNPCTDIDLINCMIREVLPDRYVVPVFGGKGGHPVLLGSRIVDEFREKTEILNLRKALEGYRRSEVSSSSDRVLLNINTPESYLYFSTKQSS